MKWLERIFVGLFLSAFLALFYLIFFDAQKKSLNTNRIISKMQTVQDLIVDLKDLSKSLQIKNAVANLQASNTDISFIENSFKIAMVSEIIEIKAQMMEDAISQAIDEVKKPTSYFI